VYLNVNLKLLNTLINSAFFNLMFIGPCIIVIVEE